MELRWQWCSFDGLEMRSMYAVLCARQDVFVVEQRCIYPDIDGRDKVAHHLLGWDDRQGIPALAAYLRVLPPNTRYKEVCIGRVLTTRAYRSQRLGHPLMARGIACTLDTYGACSVRIMAQTHLQGFYARHGFVGEGEEFDEDGIVHREMVRP